MRRLLPLALAGLAAVAAAGTAAASPAYAAAGNGSLPPHLYAPYFQTWDSADGGLAQLSVASGAKYLTLAFLETDQAGSCNAYWNGSTSTPISASAPGSFGAEIAAVQRAGGNVIPSFGGYTADTTGTELADSCTNANAIAKVYESLITTYHVPRIDLDIEANSLADTAAVKRRNQAIAETEAWAAAHGKQIQFSYTLPVLPTGLPSAELAVLQNAAAEHAKVSVVNIMTFDYYDGATHDMAADTRTAADGLHAQLASLYPHKSSKELWGMVGVTEMPGIDDYGPEETFTTGDAVRVERWAAARGIDTLSFWALQRDNGGCVGTGGANSCSGTAQDTWQFSHTFARFAGPRR